jgi:hypothetical protein
MSSTSIELRPVALQPGDLLRPLGAFEELFCLFDQRFPTNGALAAKSPATQLYSSGATRSTQCSSATRCSLPVSTQRLTVFLTFAASPASVFRCAWLHRPPPSGSGRSPKK